MSELVEFEAGTPFLGTIGKTTDVSSPAWPSPNRAAEGAPNVLIWVLDDVGFGQCAGCVLASSDLLTGCDTISPGCDNCYVRRGLGRPVVWDLEVAVP